MKFKNNIYAFIRTKSRPTLHKRKKKEKKKIRKASSWIHLAPSNAHRLELLPRSNPLLSTSPFEHDRSSTFETLNSKPLPRSINYYYSQTTITSPGSNHCVIQLCASVPCPYLGKLGFTDVHILCIAESRPVHLMWRDTESEPNPTPSRSKPALPSAPHEAAVWEGVVRGGDRCSFNSALTVSYKHGRPGYCRL